MSGDESQHGGQKMAVHLKECAGGDSKRIAVDMDRELLVSGDEPAFKLPDLIARNGVVRIAIVPGITGVVLKRPPLSTRALIARVREVEQRICCRGRHFTGNDSECARRLQPDDLALAR